MFMLSFSVVKPLVGALGIVVFRYSDFSWVRVSPYLFSLMIAPTCKTKTLINKIKPSA